MMKKILGSLLMIIGAIMVIISIMGLVKAFDVFREMQTNATSVGYLFGSIAFPLLLTVLGRWVYRKGLEFWRIKK